MNKIKYILVIAFALTSCFAQAQNEVEAIRFSRHQVIGSARYMAMGGAFGALGADPSVLSQNPAGIALYRRNEFAFTLGLNNMNSSSDYLGNTGKLNTFKGRMNSISLISNTKSSNPDFARVSFGMGYNKLINFDESYSFSGVVNGTSLLDVLVNQAAGVAPSQLGEYSNTGLYSSPAYETYLISPTDSTGGAYYHEIPYGDIQQKKIINTEGYLGELTFNAGLNIDEKVFLGAALAFPMLSYSEKTSYSETPLVDSLELDHYSFRETTRADGGGVNLKLGIIFKPVEWMRFGMAYHSPSRIAIDQTKKTTFNSSFLNGSEEYSASSLLTEYSYAVRTPARYQFNTAFLIKKKGTIAIDYEFVNYQNLGLRSTGFDDYTFESENNTIETIYKGTNNIKVGTEWRITKVISIRGGVNYQQSPYENDVTPINADIISYSGGLGYKYHGFYFDAAYSQSNTSLAHYSYNNTNPATLNKDLGQTVLTVGFRY